MIDMGLFLVSIIVKGNHDYELSLRYDKRNIFRISRDDMTWEWFRYPLTIMKPCFFFSHFFVNDFATTEK